MGWICVEDQNRRPYCMVVARLISSRPCTRAGPHCSYTWLVFGLVLLYLENLLVLVVDSSRIRYFRPIIVVCGVVHTKYPRATKKIILLPQRHVSDVLARIHQTITQPPPCSSRGRQSVHTDNRESPRPFLEDTVVAVFLLLTLRSPKNTPKHAIPQSPEP